MKKYLHTLLADLEEAKNNRPTIRPRKNDDILPLEFEHFQRDDSDEIAPEPTPETPTHKGNIREKMGLTQEQFPPADYWSDEEAALLEKALNDLFQHYNLAADYPQNLPPKMAYTTLVGALEKHAPIMSHGEWHLEFCNYEPSECPFGEHCSCKNIEIHDFTEGVASSEYDELPWETDAENPNNVLGVYNYCDAWCERCAFNTRCAISRKEGDLETDAMVKLGLWQDHSEAFLAAKKWLKTQNHQAQNRIEPLEEERQIFDVEENQVRRDVKSVAVVQLAQRYEKHVTAWLKDHKIEILLGQLSDLLKEKNIALGNSKNTEGSEKKTWEAFAVVQWYVFFIYVKLSRGVEGKIDEDDFSDEGYPKDSEGSAKIALIGAERSLVAWQQIMHHAPEETAFSLKMMTLLEAIIFEGDKEFPEARKFVRPGFDELEKY
jgi:hypothetical protein